MAMLPDRRVAWWLIGLLSLGMGCSPFEGGSSCEPPPKATDAGQPSVALVGAAAPCRSGTEAAKSSDPHLYVTFQCPGESTPFLAAVKVDGKRISLREVTCAGYGTSSTVDLGSWDPGDTLWHNVEVILDPLNLFKESDETNNRAIAKLRVTAPDIGVYADLCRFRLTEDAGSAAGTAVDHVSAGTPVNVWTYLDVAGKYAIATISMRSGASLQAQTVRQFLTCDDINQGLAWSQRWTPPGPGNYDVEFRVTPEPGAVDRDPSNNVFVRRLVVDP